MKIFIAHYQSKIPADGMYEGDLVLVVGPDGAIYKFIVDSRDGKEISFNRECVGKSFLLEGDFSYMGKAIKDKEAVFLDKEMIINQKVPSVIFEALIKT